jgi:glycosyltransferase involved in cell wall biosynthesis
MKNTKKKKVALYDPYLNTMGGGEKHILSILKVLEDNGFQIEVFWDKGLGEEILSKLGLRFENLKFVTNIFSHKNTLSNIFKLKKYEHFFYVTDGSYFFSGAKNNYVFCMVPKKNLYNLNFLNKLKTRNFDFLANSQFTGNWLKKWHINAEIIYPYIDELFFAPNSTAKEKIILNVGRFFAHRHSKRQDVAISWFKDLKQKYQEFKEYRLVLAGSYLEEDSKYLEELQKMAKERSDIVFKINPSYKEIIDLYHKAKYYWHFAGFEVDENINPENTEHLGITPIESMASGCLTFAYRAGGPKEIISDNKNGFLFETQEELFSKMLSSQNNEDEIIDYAKKYTIENFSYEAFKKRVEKIILKK